MVACLLPVLFASTLSGATPAGADTPRERLAAALEKRAEGDFAAAAELLEPKRAGKKGHPVHCGTPLEPWCAFYRADALFYSGQYAEAARVFARARSLDPKGPVADRASAREAEALNLAGEGKEAIEKLRDALERRASPELRLTLADALARQGDTAGALAEWKRLYLSHADHPAAREAARHLEALDALETLGSAELVERATRLMAVGLSKKALRVAERAAALARTPAERERARLAEGKARLQLKRYEGAADLFDELISGKATSDAVRVEAMLARGKAAMSRGDLEQASTAFEKLVKRYPDQPQAEEADFFWAWTAFNRADFKACAERFRAFGTRNPNGKRADEGLWYEGFCSRLSGDAEGAAQALGKLAQTSSKLAMQAVYWLARGEPSREKAEAGYRRIIRAAPASWYAWLARGRLAELGLKEEPFALTARATTSPEPVAERELRAVQLVELGLTQDAFGELEYLAQQSRGKAGEAARVAALCASLGLHHRAYQVANARLWGAAFEKGDPGALGMLYPTPYGELVRPAAASMGMDPYFLWAIMRRESAFDPLARSPARAFGLMQLLVSTAQRIAQLVGDPEVPGERTLEQPERIVPWASWYLAELTGRFKHAALAAAAYNGGPRNVAKWVGDRSSLPLDEFVELIPFKETRLYVKGVLGDYFTYRALYAAEGEPLPFPMKVPEPVAGVAF